MADEFPRVVTREDLRFDISFALSQIKASQWREWVLGKDLRRSGMARDMIVDQIAARFSRYQVRAPAPLPPHSLSPHAGQAFHTSVWSDGAAQGNDESDPR